MTDKKVSFEAVIERAKKVMKEIGVEIPDISFQDEEQRIKWKCQSYNETTGNLNELDGYDCAECNNRGYIAYPKYDDKFGWTEVQRVCKCQKTRSAIRKLEKSGLKNIFKDYTFQKYITSEDWQKHLKEKSLEFLKTEKSWFYIGGQVGSGKTHLCTAIACQYLKNGKDVKYMQWREDCVKLKTLINDVEYSDYIGEYKTASVLYIDDLFKPTKDQLGNLQRPTAADIQIAFEILNYRYNNKELITVISSERTFQELTDIDEAVASRIYEMSFKKNFGINITKDSNKNYRFKGGMTI
jgi:DNA replication protein DnaC